MPTQEYNAVQVLRAREQKRAARLVYKALTSQIDRVILAIESGFPNPDYFIEQSPIQTAYETFYRRIGVLFAKRTYRQITKLSTKDRANDLTRYWIDYVQDYVSRKVANRIAKVTANTKSIVRRVVSRGQSLGWSNQKIARSLRVYWPKISRSRAIVIARTETLSASNAGSMAGADYISKELGFAMEKTWLARIDGRTRDPHRAANGQTKPLDEDFTVGGEKMSFPGDTRGSAKNTIQCRCVVTYRVL